MNFSNSCTGPKPRAAWVLVAAFPALVLLSGGPVSGQCTNYANFLHRVSSLSLTGSYAKDVAFLDDYALVVDDHRLHVVDMANPGQPVLATSYPLSISSSSIWIDGDHAYLTNDNALGNPQPLSIIDISDPLAPYLLGSTSGNWDARDVVVANNRAYVADNKDNRLVVYNVSDPAAPFESATVDFNPSAAKSLVLVGSYVYVANLISGIRIVDITNPDEPSLVTSFTLPGILFWEIEAANGLLYAAGYSYLSQREVLFIFDITDPVTPQLLGSITTPFTSGDPRMAVAGDLCYFSASDTNIQVINVSNPQFPALSSVIPKGPGSLIARLAVHGSLLYELRLGYGMTITSVSSPGPLVPIGALDTSGNAQSIALASGRADVAYVADGAGGFHVIDVTNPQVPVLLHTVPTPGSAADIAVSGTTAYVADSAAGLQIYDVTDPFGTTPSWLGGAPTADLAVGVAVVDTLAYVADTDGGLRIFNVKIPTAPAARGFNDTLDAANSVVIAGNYAYVADGAGGLRTLNVSDPDNPWLIGNAKSRTAVNALDVTLSGSRAFVAAGDSGLVIMDAVNPANVVELGRIGTGDAALAVRVAGTYAYVADNASGLRVYDIQDSAAPLLLGNVDVPSNSQGVFLTDDYAYVAAGTAGLQICPSQCGYTDAVTADFTADVTEAFYPVLIHFTNFSTGYAVGYHWDFGDGVGISTSVDPSYYYDQPGDYTVTLTVTGSGNTDVMTRVISVLAEKPRISAITDAPNDQGGWVYVDFHHSGYDDTQPNRTELYTIQSQDDGVWVTLTTSGAYGDPTYRVLVPSRANGAASAKPYRVIAHMDEGIWISDPRSGYSEDNIAPETPENVAWQAADLLDWAPVAANDLDRYEVYGADVPDFATAELVAVATESQAALDAAAHPWVFVIAIDVNGLASAPSSPLTATAVTDLPASLALGRAHPNPFNPATTISYALPRSGRVHLAVYDLGGRLVRRMVDGPQQAGHHAAIWRGRDDTGRPVPSGAYIYRLEADGKTLTRRMTLLK